MENHQIAVKVEIKQFKNKGPALSNETFHMRNIKKKELKRVPEYYGDGYFEQQ